MHVVSFIPEQLDDKKTSLDTHNRDLLSVYDKELVPKRVWRQNRP